MSAVRTERLLNLVICLLATRRFVSKERIRSAVPQYAACDTDQAFDRMFERDKDDLREMGIPVETGTDEVWFDDEVGYRIDRDAYALPTVSFAPDEVAALGLAARVWEQASLADAASGALLKLKASGVEFSDAATVGIEPQVRAGEPAFAPLYEAVRDQQPVSFSYRSRGAADAMQRHLEPWAVVSWHGRWYVVGHDRDRRATRVFRLGRIVGHVAPNGPAGSVRVPAGVDVRAQVAMLAGDPPTAVARLRLRSGAALPLRRRAQERRDSGVEGWDEVDVAFADDEALAEEVVAYGRDAVVLAPETLRTAVQRRLRAVLTAVPA